MGPSALQAPKASGLARGGAGSGPGAWVRGRVLRGHVRRSGFSRERGRYRERGEARGQGGHANCGVGLRCGGGLVAPRLKRQHEKPGVGPGFCAVSAAGPRILKIANFLRAGAGPGERPRGLPPGGRVRPGAGSRQRGFSFALRPAVESVGVLPVRRAAPPCDGAAAGRVRHGARAGRWSRRGSRIAAHGSAYPLMALNIV